MVQLIIGQIVLIINALKLFLEMIDHPIDESFAIGSIGVEALGINWSGFNHRRSMVTVEVVGKLLKLIRYDPLSSVKYLASLFIEV